MLHSFFSTCKSRYRKLVKWSRKNPGLASIYVGAMILAAIPIVFLGCLLVRRSVNVPFWDEWVYVDSIDKWRHGHLTMYDVWHQHNEHRVMVPKICLILLASLTGWNIRFEVMANFFTGLFSFTFLALLLRNTFKKKLLPFFVALPIIAWLFFSPIQYINWIWGFELAWFMSVLGVVFAIWSLTKSQLHKIDFFFVAAIVGAFVATYSLGNGMLIWLVGFGLLVYRKAPRTHLYTWLAAGGVTVASYLYHFQRPLHDSPFFLLRHRLRDLCDYFFTYLGRNLATTQPIARNVGLVLFVLCLVGIFMLWRKKLIGPVIPWIALGLYGLLTAVLAAFSRMSEFGVDHAMVQSYTTISVLFVIGTIVILIKTADAYLATHSTKTLRQYLIIAFVFGLLAYPLAIGFWNNYTKGVTQLKELSAHFSKVRHCIFTVQSKDDDCLDLAYPFRDVVWKDLNTLKRDNWDHINEQ